MNGKIVYAILDGQVAFAVVGADPIFNAETHAAVSATLTRDILDNPGRYFYVNGNVVKDYYGSLELLCDQSDSDADGVKDMPADGSSLATFTIKKKDRDGNYAQGTEVISVAATRGLLSARQVTLSGGQGSFTLRSIEETVSIAVSVSHAKLGQAQESLQLVP